MWLSILDTGASSLRLGNRAKITILMCEQSPMRYGFCAGTKAIPRYSVNIPLASVVWFDIMC